MKIAIDISPTKNNHKGRGIGVYTELLVAALKKYQPQHEYIYCTDTIPREADVVHYPYFDPFFLTLPIKKSKPTIVTVHDLIPLVFPEHFPKGMRGWIKWNIQKISLLSASRIITDSCASKEDIVRIVGYAKDKINPIYLAPSPVFSQPLAKKRTLTIPDQFVLYVGDVNWNKNVLGLLHALKKTDLHLVCVGKAFLHDQLPEVHEIQKTIKDLNLSGRIHMVGYVENEDLSYLYNTASCLVVPSYYEGFGLPVLEAFASGGIVVSADNSSLREINGPAISVDASSTHSIAKGLLHATHLSKKDRVDLIEKGKVWVMRFTWEKVAKETVNVYEHA